MLFLTGALCDPALLAQVLGRLAELLPARAAGRPGALLAPQGDDLPRLRFYAAAQGWEPGRHTVTPQAGGAAQEALAFLAPDAAPGGGPLARLAAKGLMALWPAIDAEEARRRWPQILARAASQLRAAAQPGPRGIRQGGGALRVACEQRPWRGFFEVSVAELDFPRFDGTRSGPVTRAGFHMADAVTVLPYDPARDRVLLVEQFRYGPALRGDPLPWTLEPIAGRLDGDETPESCARREAQEEAGLRLARLIPCGRYYPTPGAVSEYIFSFLGLCELPDGSAGTGGLAEEQEDIRAHLLDFAEAMALLARGEIETAPLHISLLQLAALRPGLRAERGRG